MQQSFMTFIFFYSWILERQQTRHRKDHVQSAKGIQKKKKQQQKQQQKQIIIPPDVKGLDTSPPVQGDEALTSALLSARTLGHDAWRPSHCSQTRKSK